MKKVIATTTINDPTPALLKYASFSDWHVVVAGDLKTKHELFQKLENVTYLTPEDQEKLCKELSDAIGWKCIQRRNMAMLKALSLGADVVAVIDDDNMPYDDWGKDLCVDKETEANFYIKADKDDIAFDPLGVFIGNDHLWHRGFPLELVPDREYTCVGKRTIKPDIQAVLWDGEPDVDAVCRMIYRPNCVLDPHRCPIASDRPGPVNSQNTILARRCFPDYFLFPFIGRQDDIWASYYVQAKGFQVIYTKPGVRSDRTMGGAGRYSLVNDMEKEFLGMMNNKNLLIDLKNDPESIVKYLPGGSVQAFNIWKQVINSL